MTEVERILLEGKRPNHRPPVDTYAGDHTIEDERQPGDEPASTDPWPALDPDALYGLAGDIVRAIAPTTESDPVALLGQILVAVGNVIGRGPHFRVEADEHHMAENMVLVGRTSKARKGTAWGRVRFMVSAADPDWAGTRIVSGLSSGEGLIEQVRDPRRDDKGEMIDAGVTDKRLLVLEAEFAQVLKQVERTGNTLSVAVRHSWDGMTLRTLTRQSPLCATAPHVSIIGHVTDGELRRLLSTTEAANGFANPFVFLLVRRSKLLPEGGNFPEAVARPLQDRLAEAIRFARDVQQLRRDESVRGLWRERYENLSEGRAGLSGHLLARAEAHVTRLSGLYALLDGTCLIGKPHLLAALALWQYAEESVRFIWGDSLGDPVADDLLDALREVAPDGMTRTQIRDYFGRNRSGQQISRALATLAEYRLARRDLKTTGGRSAEAWYAGTT